MSTRRTFLTRAAAAWAVLRSAAGARLPAAKEPGRTRWPAFQTARAPQADCEYIVVGSGAGGGTVAARLAELGHSVLLLEAGGDPKALSGGNALHPDRNTLPEDYDVPAFHPNSTENAAMKWDFFVRHYANTEQQKRDHKYYAAYEGDPVDGVFYPRAGTLGGCTAHNAMILVYPHNQDWQDIADATGDPSWAPDRMRKYFEKLENCHHRPVDRFFKKLTGLNLSRHGFAGWLHTEKALPLEVALHDKDLVKTINDAFKVAFRAGNEGEELVQLLESQLDPNDWRLVEDNAVGIRYTPLTTNGHARTGARERLLDVQRRYPGRLRIETDALAARVLFDDDNRATGVEYRKGRKLYRTHGQPSEQGENKTARASREVILCGGAFNTPQLLMLSGIGPKAQLDRFGIKPVKILDGVGKNLQDRYEIGVVHRLTQPWSALEDATFTKGDTPYRAWDRQRRSGIYTTNGAILAVARRSSADRPLPDLFCFGLLGDFQGYYPGYSTRFANEHDRLTWAILKAHTQNRGGEVTLKVADPRVAPQVNFHYFEEGTGNAAQDLDSVVAGIRFVRKLTNGLPFIKEEEAPGPDVQTGDQLRTFVRDNAWGHHASCTCKIGKESEGGVLGSDFRVHGVKGLRVVDASIFPRIPGFFIVSSIYIAAEKAAAVIHGS